MFQQLDKLGGQAYLAIVLQYILERGELSNKDAFFDIIEENMSPEVGENTMTIAEQLRIEGMQKGKLDGKLEMAQSMLADGVDLVFIAKYTQLSLEVLKDMKKKNDQYQ